jgi:hypothetical protein
VRAAVTPWPTASWKQLSLARYFLRQSRTSTRRWRNQPRLLGSKIFQLHSVAGVSHFKRQSGESGLPLGCHFTRPSPLVLGQAVRSRGGGHGPKEGCLAIDQNCRFLLKKNANRLPPSMLKKVGANSKCPARLTSARSAATGLIKMSTSHAF